MAETNFRGPVISMGSCELDAGTTASLQPMDGPSAAYQGYSLLDPRSFVAKDGTAPARITAFAVNPDILTVDGVPQAASTTAIAAAQALATAGNLPFALATVGVAVVGSSAQQLAVGVPFLPGGTTVVTTVIAIDFGFTQGTTTANSSTVNVSDNTLFTQGQWICIGNVANSANTASLLTQVTGISSSNLTTITVSPSPVAAWFAPIGAANLFGSNLLPPPYPFGTVAPAPVSVSRDLGAGVLRVHNPREQLARSLSVTASASTGGTSTILVTGYDIWGSFMTELLTASGTTTIFGKKAFKYVLAVTGQTTGAASYSIGLSDTFGFPIRCDEALTIDAGAATAWLSNTAGITTATTAVANNTTGDVRGTVQLSALGAGTPIANVATTNGTSRLWILQNVSIDRLVAATPNSSVSLFGVAQSTT